MQDKKQQLISHKGKENTVSNEKFYDSLEEDYSDNFSSDSLEFQYEKEYRERRSLTLEKHHRKKDSSAVERKEKWISEKSSPRERNGKKVPLYKGEVTVAHIHKLRENDFKAKDTRTETDLRMTVFTKQRKDLAKEPTRKSLLPCGTNGKGAKCFLDRWLIQANAHNCQRIEDSNLKSETALSVLMKNLDLTEGTQSKCLPGTSSSENLLSLNKGAPLMSSQSCSSLRVKRKQYNTKRDYVEENKINCGTKKGQNEVSYLQKYHERIFGLRNVGCRESLEGSSCSTFDDSTFASLTNSSINKSQEVCSSQCGDDYNFYMETIEKETSHDECQLSTDVSLNSTTFSKIRDASKVRL
ncbi:hypothetical protein ANN_10701 [Periplaneta americana]|uniref:Uncharacterized protein n=1 Tax=Periplaneta americana TaxID=6978 RepID=A0ABQ8T477_PERAM|nr:hypothetical protein ANN_10701 [Periplaneta americana]